MMRHVAHVCTHTHAQPGANKDKAHTHPKLYDRAWQAQNCAVQQTSLDSTNDVANLIQARMCTAAADMCTCKTAGLSHAWITSGDH